MISSHLVIKRGHRGRYRFVLMTEDGRITGEVAVAIGRDRDLARSRAVAKIVSLAQTLSAALAGDGRSTDASPYTCEIEQADKGASDTILGDRHGQI